MTPLPRRSLRRALGPIVLLAVAFDALAVTSARAQPFRLVEPGTGQLAAFADLNGPTLVIQFGAFNQTYARRIDLDEPGFWTFELAGANQFVQWPAKLPGFMRFGMGAPDGIFWNEARKGVQPLGPPPGTVTIVSRNIEPNPPLAPQEVTVTNTHREDLIVGFVDLRKPVFPPRAKEHTIAKGTAKKFLLDRDAGAQIVTVFTTVLANGATVEQVERIPIPPSPIWDLVVWEYKVTYQVAGQPELDMKSRRSIGVVNLPPGAAMPPTLDVHRAALEAGNPGAASAYAQPVK